MRINDDTMELWNQGEMFVVVKMASHVYPVKLEVIPPKGALAAYTELTRKELVEHLGRSQWLQQLVVERVPQQL